jgi:hypothetical protein
MVVVVAADSCNGIVVIVMVVGYMRECTKNWTSNRVSNTSSFK